MSLMRYTEGLLHGRIGHRPKGLKDQGPSGLHLQNGTQKDTMTTKRDKTITKRKQMTTKKHKVTAKR